MSQCANGASENDAGEMSKYLNQCRNIATLVNCTVINVHHTKKDSDDFRGSSTIEGNLDFMIAVKRNTSSKNNLTTVRLHKMKEASTRYRWELSLNEVKIDAINQEGEHVKTLCVHSNKLDYLNEVHDTNRKKNPSQCENDAECILGMLKSGGYVQSLKQIQESILSQFGQIKNVRVRIDRAKKNLIERKLITSEKSGNDVLIRLMTKEESTKAA
jgi:hypothetical protein